MQLLLTNVSFDAQGCKCCCQHSVPRPVATCAAATALSAYASTTAARDSALKMTHRK